MSPEIETKKLISSFLIWLLVIAFIIGVIFLVVDIGANFTDKNDSATGSSTISTSTVSSTTVKTIPVRKTRYRNKR